MIDHNLASLKQIEVKFLLESCFKDIVDLARRELFVEILSKAVKVHHRIKLAQAGLYVLHLSLDIEKRILDKQNNNVRFLFEFWLRILFFFFFIER